MARNTTYKCHSCNKDTSTARPVGGCIICSNCHYSLVASRELKLINGNKLVIG